MTITKKETFEDLNLILRRFESMERLLKDDDRLTAEGAEYLTRLLEIVRTGIKKRMFYVLMDFMSEQNKPMPDDSAAESESVCERE